MQKRKIQRYFFYLVGFCIFVPIAFVGVIELSSWYSLRHVKSLSDEVGSCESLESVEVILGPKFKSVEEPLELEYWLGEKGVLNRDGYNYSKGDILHIFTHDGPPYRFIYVLMNSESTKVVESGWSHM